MAQLKEGSIIKKSTGDEVIATLNDLNTHKVNYMQHLSRVCFLCPAFLNFGKKER